MEREKRDGKLRWDFFEEKYFLENFLIFLKCIPGYYELIFHGIFEIKYLNKKIYFIFYQKFYHKTSINFHSLVHCLSFEVNVLNSSFHTKSVIRSVCSAQKTFSYLR